MNCSLIINNTQNITNNSITKLITQNFSMSGFNNGTYRWQVNCTDNSSRFNTANSSSRMFNVKLDVEPPIVQLVNPPNKTVDTDGNRTFFYNVSDTISELANCSLIINNNINRTNTTFVVEDRLQNFSVGGFNDGEYNWSVNCTDNSENLNKGESAFRNLTVINDNIGIFVTLLAAG